MVPGGGAMPGCGMGPGGYGDVETIPGVFGFGDDEDIGFMPRRGLVGRGRGGSRGGGYGSGRGGSVEADSVEDWDRWVDQKC